MELPFKLYKYHKKHTIKTWKRRGLIATDEEIEEIYQKYIYATHCELCNKQFPNTKDRCMEHDHDIGKFRNIVCVKCNMIKTDKQFKNANDMKYITKMNIKDVNQGFGYRFRFVRDKKVIIKKVSIDLKKIQSIRDKFVNENPQYFT
jgi:hypothetical protein